MYRYTSSAPVISPYLLFIHRRTGEILEHIGLELKCISYSQVRHSLHNHVTLSIVVPLKPRLPLFSIYLPFRLFFLLIFPNPF
jgi:hypothetical protein